MLCDEPVASQESTYLDLLGKAVAWRYAFGQLALTYKLDGDVFGELRFAPLVAPPAAPADDASAASEADAAALEAMVAGIVANPWQWTSFSRTDEEITVEDPASYTVTFNEDGTLDIKADCNDATGAYVLDGANITMEIGPATLAACAGDSRSEQFLQLLGDTASVLPLGSQLFAPSKTEGSTMMFEAVITTVADLCGEQALAINTVEDTLAPRDQRPARSDIG
jgi:heat shock protein HslJ